MNGLQITLFRDEIAVVPLEAPDGKVLKTMGIHAHKNLESAPVILVRVTVLDHFDGLDTRKVAPATRKDLFEMRPFHGMRGGVDGDEWRWLRLPLGPLIVTMPPQVVRHGL